MSNFSVRAALVAVLLSTTTGGLLASRLCPECKGEIETSAYRENKCTSLGGCRPVAPGCHLELVRTGIPT